MIQNLQTEASKVWSGLTLMKYYENVQKVLRAFPLYISNDMKIRIVKDNSDDDSTLNTQATMLGGAAVRQTELAFDEIDLIHRVVEEPIPIASQIIGESFGYSLLEKSMYDLAYKLEKDYMLEAKTLITTDGNYTAAREIDLAGVGYVKWNVPGTALPQSNIQELLGKFVASTNCDIDDPRITLLLGQSLIQHIVKTTDYLNYKARRITPESNIMEQKMIDYFGINNVVLLPSSFGNVALIVFSETPTTTISIANVNVNQSTIISGAYNLQNPNQPIEYQLANGVRVTENRVFIGGRTYLPEHRHFHVAQAFTFSKVFIHNVNALTRLKNII